MRALITAVALATAVWLPAADEPKQNEMQAELKKLQGLWQQPVGGLEHRGGRQVVRQPSLRSQHFFVCGDRLIWLDNEGKPEDKEATITLDVKADPKRITLTPIGGRKDRKPTQGIYSATDSSVVIHVGLNGGPAPKQFLKMNQPVKGVDGTEWLFSRKKLQEK